VPGAVIGAMLTGVSVLLYNVIAIAESAVLARFSRATLTGKKLGG
jgi:hypothetical protein